MIKIDIEGGELMALQGMMETLKQERPILLIAIYHSVNDFLNIPYFIYNLKLNYAIKIFKIQPFHPTDETFLIAFPKEIPLLKNRYV